MFPPKNLGWTSNSISKYIFTNWEFGRTKQNISLHINNIFKEGELKQISVVKDFLTTALDGKKYRTKYYNLDVIISVGYRIKSIRGTQFRQWANKVLKEYLLHFQN